jgi:hypothetical protein
MRIAAPSLTLLVLAGAASGCGEHVQAIANPFQARGGVGGGLESGLWGDGSSGPAGMHLGCIPFRHFALWVTAHNRTAKTITILGAGGAQPFATLMERVAVQVRLAPPPPTGDRFISGLRAWSRNPGESVAIPPGRDAWVQSDFLMRNCALLHPHTQVILNRSITLVYRADGAGGSESIAGPGARIILTRPPRVVPEITAEHG